MALKNAYIASLVAMTTVCIVGGQYGAPHSSYKPAPSYKKPPSYESPPTHPPKQEYKPAPSYKPAKQEYKPAPSYKPSKQEYKPAPPYKPTPSYKPAPSYEPSPTYSHHGYGSRHRRSPQSSYLNPHEPEPYKPTSYESPKYEPPKEEYKPTSYDEHKYDPPKKEYKPTSYEEEKYEPPKKEYEPPKKEYEPPKKEYEPPKKEYKPTSYDEPKYEHKQTYEKEPSYEHHDGLLHYVIDVNGKHGGSYEVKGYPWKVDCNGHDYDYQYGYISGIWDDKDDFEDIDKVKCSGGKDSYGGLKLDLKHQKRIELSPKSSAFTPECYNGFVLTGLWDDHYGYRHVIYGKCTKVEYGEIDYDHCQNFYTKYKDGGPYDPYSKWNVQCPKDWAAVGLRRDYHRTDHLRCCKINHPHK